MKGEIEDRTSRARGLGGLLAVLVGVGIGGVLARGRGPLTPDLVDVAGVLPAAAAWVRAASLVFAGLIVLLAGPTARRNPGLLLFGVALGVATRLADPVDGALFVGHGEPLLALLPWAALAIAAATAARGSAASPGDTAATVRVPVLVGLAICAAGVAIQIEGIARLARRLGLGGAGDDAVLACVFATLVAIGAAAFGRAIGRSDAVRVAGAVAVTAVLTILALPIVAGIAEPLGFKALCARFGADASLAGTPRIDAAVGLTAFVLPALAVGAALHVARGSGVIAVLLIGAAIGTVAAQALIDADPITRLTGTARVGAPGLVRTGAVVVGLGLVAQAAAAGGHARTVAVTLGGSLTVVGALLPISKVPVLDPWERFPVAPTAIFETSSGQFLIEPAGGVLRRVTLDQRPLSPRADELLADVERIRASLDAVRDSTGERVRSVLVVGLVTPERAAALVALGVERFDRTAHWWRAMRLLEAELFDGAAPSSGRVVAPALARSRHKSGEYDAVLVLSPGVHRALPVAPPGDNQLTHWTGPAIVWLDGARPIAHLRWTPRILLASGGIESFSIALTSGLERVDSPRGERPPAPSILASMGIRPDERPRRAWRDAAARLASAPDARPFERALALHAAAQRISSPFESRAHRVELDPDALALWRDHAVAAPSLSRFERGVIEGLARVIEGKREVPLAYEILEPIAEAHPPWPALVRTLAWADAEELEFDEAVGRLEPLWIEGPDDVQTARAYASALLDLDRAAEAAAALRRVSDARPSDRDLRTELADALVAAGDPEGRRIAADLLRDDPRNPVLFGLARGMRGMDTLEPDSTPMDGR